MLDKNHICVYSIFVELVIQVHSLKFFHLTNNTLPLVLLEEHEQLILITQKETKTGYMNEMYLKMIFKDKNILQLLYTRVYDRSS